MKQIVPLKHIFSLLILSLFVFNYFNYLDLKTTIMLTAPISLGLFFIRSLYREPKIAFFNLLVVLFCSILLVNFNYFIAILVISSIVLFDSILINHVVKCRDSYEFLDEDDDWSFIRGGELKLNKIIQQICYMMLMVINGITIPVAILILLENPFIYTRNIFETFSVTQNSIHYHPLYKKGFDDHISQQIIYAKKYRKFKSISCQEDDVECILYKISLLR